MAKEVPEVELERAKAAAISSVLMNLESRAVVAEDIGRQVGESVGQGWECGRGGVGWWRRTAAARWGSVGRGWECGRGGVRWWRRTAAAR